MTNDIIKMCINLLNEEDIKTELKEIYTPVISVVLDKLMPYIYLALIFLLINFLLILMIFFLLVKNKIPSFSNIFYKLRFKTFS